MNEWFAGLGSEGQLATWLVASFLLYVLASQLIWQSHWFLRSANPAMDAVSPPLSADRQWPDGRISDWIDRVRDHPLFPWALELVRLVYYLGLPFLAAVNGLLRADLLGISGTDWAAGDSLQGFRWEDWARGIGWAAGAILIAGAVWLLARQQARKAELTPVVQGISGPLWVRWLDTLYDQVHWAFYRSGPTLWFGNLYWGTFAGLGFALLELALNPALWWKLRSPETAGPVLIRLGLAWVTALLFLATQNLWLTAGVHLVLASLLRSPENGGYAAVDGSAQ